MNKFLLTPLSLLFCLAACSPSLEDQLDEMANQPSTSETVEVATYWTTPPKSYPKHLEDLKIFRPTKEETDHYFLVSVRPERLTEMYRGIEELAKAKQEYERVKYICSERYDPAYYPFGMDERRYVLELRGDTRTPLERALEARKLTSESCQTECPELYPAYAEEQSYREDCKEEKKAKRRLETHYGVTD